MAAAVEPEVESTAEAQPQAAVQLVPEVELEVTAAAEFEAPPLPAKAEVEWATWAVPAKPEVEPAAEPPPEPSQTYIHS